MLATDSLWAVLTLGFSLGLVHAFDADHIMAVSGLAMQPSEGRSRWRTVTRSAAYCVRWALGHGGILAIVTVALIGFDLHLPAEVPMLAEKAVGVFLVGLGVWIIVQARRHRIGLHIHSHGDVQHAHLVTDDSVRHDHKPVLLGMTHGLAGSAPFLAMLPVLEARSYPLAFGYMALFCLGVVVAMLMFGLCLGRLQAGLATLGERVLQVSRLVIGAASVGFGVYWLAG